jgi:uncharacterized membrane protein YkoI
MLQATVPARSLHLGHDIGVSRADAQDHDDALGARARGEIKSLDEILQTLTPRKSDRMVDVVLERRDGRYIYEVTWLTKTGRYRIFTIDATDGRILKDETK